MIKSELNKVKNEKMDLSIQVAKLRNQISYMNGNFNFNPRTK